MGRLRKFIVKAGDFAQQVSNEIQRPDQTNQGYSEQPGQPQYQRSNQHMPQQSQYQSPVLQGQSSHQPKDDAPPQIQQSAQYARTAYHPEQQNLSLHGIPQTWPQTQLPSPDHQHPQAQVATSEHSRQVPRSQQTIHKISVLPSGLRPITECPDGPITFALDWFVHGSAPGFPICSRCYADHIFNSQFSTCFIQTHLPGGKSRLCLFSTPRVRDVLWPRAIASSSLEELVRHMKMRPGLPLCPEANFQAGKSWYTPLGRPELTFCPSCYEDKIRSGPFETCFQIQIIEDSRICHHALWSIRGMLTIYTKSGNWQGFLENSLQRLKVDSCPRTELIMGSERIWYISSRGPDGFKVCEACFWDYFRDTRDGPTFQPRRAGVHEQNICLMSQMNFLISIQRALELGNLDVFWHAAEGISKNPLCTAQGVAGARWFTLQNNPPEFDVCGACLSGIVEPLGLGHYFHMKTSIGPTDIRLCNFNIHGFWRALLYLEKLFECLYVGFADPLNQFAMSIAHSPACPKINRQEAGKNRRWWGWHDVHICEECYIVSIRGSSLEPNFELRDQDITEPRICDMFSARMRSLYHGACEINDLNGFLEFARRRRQIFLQTMPECDRLLQQAKFALSQAQTLGLAAVTFSAAGNLTDTTWGHSYTVGNSVVGHGYANEQLLNAAMADHQMQGMSAAAAGPAVIARVGMLEKTWKEVE